MGKLFTKGVPAFFNSALGVLLGLILGVCVAVACGPDGEIPDPNKIMCDGQKLGTIKTLLCPVGQKGQVKEICSPKNAREGQWLELSRKCIPDNGIPDECKVLGEKREVACPAGEVGKKVEQCSMGEKNQVWKEIENTCKVACEEPIPPAEIVTFADEIGPLFKANCTSCHATQAPKIGGYAIAKKEIDEIIKHMDPGSSKVMPPSGALSEAHRNLVKTWKADGLLEDDGADPKPDPDDCEPDPDPDPDPDPTPDTGVDQDGIKRIYKPTGKEVKMNYGSRHEKGDRYNANHAFINYEVTGYYLTANTEKIEMKTDGPNHSGCDKMPKCMWAEPQFEIKGSKATLGAEYPHPTNHDKDCPSCVALGGDLSGKWMGYKVIAYTKGGFRNYEQWVDVGLTGDKPGNNWKKVMHEVDKGQILPGSPERTLPTDDKGLEAEIRCHGGHKTEMKYGKIVEIEPPK